MSAWIVPKSHIDFLIHAARVAQPVRYGSMRYGADYALNVSEHADDIGRDLWHENVKSVMYRYNERSMDTLPGPNDFDHEALANYRYTPLPFGMAPALTVEYIATVCKAIDCYDYQSCEHPEWSSSAAYAFCAALRETLCSKLPGYKEANAWPVEPPAPAPCVCGNQPERGDKFCGECGARVLMRHAHGALSRQ
jgi:hypothetical protein